jgi:DNA invertase Pin-like site-specific DNA recombinase
VLRDKLAEAIAVAQGMHYKRGALALNKESQSAAARRLAEYGVFSIAAIAALLDLSVYRVEESLKGLPHPKARGKLNPDHLTDLAYMLSFGRVKNGEWVKRLYENGTSISTIAELTGISKSTLWRKLD